MLSEIFKSSRPLIGMVHLQPLPGAPRFGGNLADVEARAINDVNALIEGGAHGILFENYFDAPFTKIKVGALTVSAMTKVISKCTENLSLPFGVNVLRNDWEAALAVTAATGGSFIRVNILSGIYATDQGIIEGEAYHCLRLRKAIEKDIGRKILILGDVHTKHSNPLLFQTIEDAAKDLIERTGIEGMIVTGARTGAPAYTEDIQAVANVAGEVPVFVGSGINAENVHEYSPLAYGFIVGTYIKKDGKLENPVDPARVRELVGLLGD